MTSSALSPADASALVAELSTLLTVMPRAGGGSAADLKAVIRIYLADLADLPADAVRRAIADFRRGVRGEGLWAPTPAQIAIAVRQEIAEADAKARALPSGGPLVRVEQDSPQGDAWAAYNRALGVSTPWPNGHWYFSSEFPPGWDAARVARELRGKFRFAVAARQEAGETTSR